MENRQPSRSSLTGFLLVTFDFPPEVGGISTRVANYSKKLVEKGKKVLVLHLTSDRSVERRQVPLSRHNGLTIIECVYSPLRILSVFALAVRAVRRFSPDVVHVFSGNDTPIGSLLLLYGRLKRCSAGVSVFGMDLLRSKARPIRRIFLSLSLMLAKRIGANSKATAALIPSSFRDKVGILYPGVDTHIPEHLGLIEKEKTGGESVLFVGRLVRRKGVHDLLRSFKILSGRRPRARLTMVGSGPCRESLENLAEDLGISGRIRFAGTLSGTELHQEYSKCDVFVMPSRQTQDDVEGFGIVFLEAGLFGKPCVATRTGGIPEAVLDQRTGLLVEQGDIEAIAGAMDLLLSDRALAAELGQRARHRILSEFSWDKATSRLLGLHLPCVPAKP